MSKERINDFLAALHAAGWKCLNPAAMFDVENEVISWKIEHQPTQRTLDLEFHLFGFLGRRTESLSDILYCVVPGTDMMLYFDKLKSEQWKQSVPEFIKALIARVNSL
jgi:hypothetical protein